MKSFIIKKNDAGQRVDKFITKACPLLPQTMMYKAIRTKNIKLNRKRCDISTRLQEGDVLDIYLKDEFFQAVPQKYDFLKASGKLNIVYEDENIILADKRVGVIVHQDDSYQTDTLISRIKRYLYEKGEYIPDNENSFVPALVNRIDRNTGGIVIAAKNAEALRILNDKMRDRELKKEYVCVVHGILSKKEDILEGYLVKDSDKNRVYISKKCQDGYKKIRTKYKVIAESNDLSLLNVELLTGRTHQIRAHFASIGHPLLGDGKYGTNKLNKDYSTGNKQALYSYRLSFNFKSDAGILNYLKDKSFGVDSVWFAEKYFGVIIL